MYLSSDQKSLFSAPDSTDRIPAGVSTLLEKGSGEMCEDAVLTAGNTYGVFDGATSLVSTRYGGNLTGGKMASMICAEVFAAESGDLAEIADAANQMLGRRAKSAGVDYSCKDELWSCSAAVVRLEEDHLHWCRIGDSQILLLYGDGRVTGAGSTVDHDAPTLLGWQQRSGSCEGSIMEVMGDEIVAVRRRMNIDYGVFSGEPEALDFLQTGTLPREDIEHVLLFTDGLMMPRSDPAAPPDYTMLAGLYMEKGLCGIRDYVRSLQLGDLSCRRFPRFKIHDDIGAVALDLTI